jgi:hypothetical protein
MDNHVGQTPLSGRVNNFYIICEFDTNSNMKLVN